MKLLAKMGRTADKAYLRVKIRNSCLNKFSLRWLLATQVRKAHGKLHIEVTDLSEALCL